MLNRQAIRYLIKYIAKKSLYVLCFVIIVTIIVLLSRNLNQALYLRKWRNETNDYVPLTTTLNSDINQKLFEFLKLNSSYNNDISRDNNYTVSNNDTDSGIGNYVPNRSSINSEEQEEVITCKPLPPRSDFSECGNRIADRKCCEYIWAWKYKRELLEYSECSNSGYGVIGGIKAEQGAFPHMAAVGFKRLNFDVKTESGKTNNTKISKYSYMCGGSLISEEFVLTAAHCTFQAISKVHEEKPSVVALGEENLTQKTQIVKIKDIIPHNKYASPKHDYDIALLRLWDPVVFTFTIHPACLSTQFTPQYHKVNVTGWGTVNPEDHTTMSDHLVVGTVYIVTRDKCKKELRRYYNRNFVMLRYHQLCAGNTNEKVDSCKGDSGGPLQVRINTTYGNIHRIIGVTSFGIMCATEVPAVYVSVSTLIFWIEKIVWPIYREDYYEGLGSITDTN